MSKHYVLTRRVGILLFAAAILANVALSYPNLRRFVDLSFIEGMAAIICGAYYASFKETKIKLSNDWG